MTGAATIDDRSLAERIVAPLALLPEEDRAEALADTLSELTDDELRFLLSWEGQRRPSQTVDAEEDATFVGLIGGRGSGKTRGGAEGILDRHEAGLLEHGALISRTPGDVRRVMIEGPDSGLVKCGERRGIKVHHQPSLMRVILSGAGRTSSLTTYSAHEPDALRGPEHDTLWADEFAAWPDKRDSMGNTAFSNAVAGLRAGSKPLGIFSTTPKAVPAVREIMTDTTGLWRVARMSTWSNAANLAPGFITTLKKLYAGTRLEAQEFEGLFLEDAEGALWATVDLETTRIIPAGELLGASPVEELLWAVQAAEAAAGGLPWRWVAVDPSASETGSGDECGIVIGGVGMDRHLYVIADLSGKWTPRQWAELVAWACDVLACPAVVEGNLAQGLVAETLRATRHDLPIEWVRARDNKRARAEPVSVLWQGHHQMAHIVGRLPALEAELTGWDARSNKSPNRLDALAWLGHKALEVMFAGELGIAGSGGGSGIVLPT